MSTGLHSDLTGQHLTNPPPVFIALATIAAPMARGVAWLFLLHSLCDGAGAGFSKWARDQQVIEVMLAGLYVNANQTYFDGRLKVDNPQSRADRRDQGWRFAQRVFSHLQE